MSTDDPPPETNEEAFQVFRNGLSFILRSVFEADETSRGSQKLYPLLTQFKQQYMKVKTQFPNDVENIVINELRLRLNFMVEATDHAENRQAVLSFLVMAALILFRAGDHELLFFLGDYCHGLHLCEEPSVRINICYLIGFVFTNWQEVMKGCADMWSPEFFDPDLRDALYEIFLVRRRDKNSDVRAAVTEAVSRFQHMVIPEYFKPAHNMTPKDIIKMGLRDKEHTARLEAIQRVDTKCADFDYVIELAISDRVQAVRRQAIQILGGINPVCLAEPKIQDLLKVTLTDVDKTMVQYTKETLIAPWLVFQAGRIKKKQNRSAAEISDTRTGLGPAIGKLMARVEWVNNQKDAEMIMFRCLDVVRTIISSEQRLNMADVIKVLVDDPNEPRLMCWSNQKKIKECTTADTMSFRVFMWRCCIEYCYEQTRRSNKGHVDERSRDQCFKRLAQPLKDSCETVFHMWQWKGNIVKEIHDKKFNVKFTAEDENCHNAALLDGLRVLTYLERDPSGMEKWKMLLESMLEDVTLSKSVTDYIGDCLVKIHYTDPDEAMKTVLTRINDLVLKEVDPDEVREESDPARQYLEQKPSIGGVDLNPLGHGSDELCIFKIQLISGLMKTGKFKTMNPYLQNIGTNLVGRCLQTQMKPEAQAHAMEVISIMTLMEEKVAIQYFNFIWVGFTTSGTSADIKRVCLCIFCDLVIKYGYDRVVVWRSNIYESRLIEVFIDILRDHETPIDVAVKACECAGKMLLIGDRDPEERHWVRLCTAIVMRLFHKKSIIDCRLKTCAAQFAILFCAQSRSNQMLMVNVLFEMIDSFTNDSDVKFVRGVDVKRAAMSICEWVSDEVLTYSARMMEDTKTHHFLMLKIVDHIADNAGKDLDLCLFTLCANSLDVKTIPESKVEEVQRKLAKAYDAVCIAYGNKCNPAKNLVKIQKKMDAAFRISDEESTGESAGGETKRIPTGGNGKPRTKRLPSANSKRSRQSPDDSSDTSTAKRSKSCNSLEQVII